MRSWLLLALDNNIAKLVIKCKTSKEIWDRLEILHEQKSDANKVVLQKEFFDMHLMKGEDIQSYIARTESLHAKLEDIGVKLDEGTLVSKIVSGLSRKYINFMSDWSRRESKRQTLVELIASLTAEDQLINSFKNTSIENAMVAKDSGNKKNNFKKGQFNKAKSTKTSGESSSKGKQKGNCFK